MVETRKILCLSTAHVDPPTRDWLDSQGRLAAESQNADHHVARHYYGWFVWVDEDFDHPILRPLFDLARQHGCYWLQFDADADQLEGYPTFNW